MLLEEEHTSNNEIGIGSELQYFVEKDQCIGLLFELCQTQRIDLFRTKYEEYNKILLKYLEQPLLLNAHIVDLVAPMNGALSSITRNRKGKEVPLFCLDIDPNVPLIGLFYYR
jgi:hypothetical protein